MFRFLFSNIWFFVKLVITFIFVYVGILVLLSGDGMLSFSQLCKNVMAFLAEQFQIVIRWFQVRLGN
ncbi:hypothetical protein ACNZ61_002125 [Enterococcus hirae]